MKLVNVIGWGCDAVHVVGTSASEPREAYPLGRPDFYAFDEDDYPAKLYRSLNRIVMASGQPCPDRVASYYVTSKKLRAGDETLRGLTRLLDAQILVHVFFSTNHLAVGAVQAFSEYVRKHRKDGLPAQIGLFCLSGMYECPEASGRSLVLFLGSDTPWFDLAILLDRNFITYRTGRVEEFDKYVCQFVKLVSSLAGGGDLLPLVWQVNGTRFYSVSMKWSDEPVPSSMASHLHSLLTRHISLPLLVPSRRTSNANKITSYKQLREQYPSLRKVKNLALVCTPSTQEIALSQSYSNELSKWFRSPQVFYPHLDGRRKYSSIANAHLLLLGEPPTTRILTSIQQYLASSWCLPKDVFLKLLNGSSIDFVIQNPFEIHSNREAHLIDFYLNSWGLKGTYKYDRFRLLCLITGRHLDQCFRFLRRQKGGTAT